MHSYIDHSFYINIGIINNNNTQFINLLIAYIHVNITYTRNNISFKMNSLNIRYTL